MCREKEIGIREKEMHWVLTVPAIWDDSAKQFMREAGVKVSGKMGILPRTKPFVGLNSTQANIS